MATEQAKTTTSRPAASSSAAVEVHKPESPPMVRLLYDMRNEIARALPQHISAERMSRVALTALRATPELMECDPGSFVGSMLQCAQLGLEPNTPLGQAYLIPRRKKGRERKVCTLMVGYQGMLDIAGRSGRLGPIQAHVVREGDSFRWRLGLDPTIEHTPGDRPDRHVAPITHVYAVARLVEGGAAIFRVLTVAEVELRRARSGEREGSSSPWQTDYEAMCLKTAVRALWPWLPKSAEMARAQALEVAAEVGGSQAGSWDPAVSEALKKHGVGVDDDGPALPDKSAAAITSGTATGPRPASEIRGWDDAGRVLLPWPGSPGRTIGEAATTSDGLLALDALTDADVNAALPGQPMVARAVRAGLDVFLSAREILEALAKARAAKA